MIIGFSGSQGQGKTTLIDYCTKAIPNAFCVGRGLARSILTEYNMSLDEINSVTAAKKEFQVKLLEKMNSIFTNELMLTKDVYFIERTFIDLWCYTISSLGIYNKYSKFINEYLIRCIHSQQQITHTFLLTGREQNVADDGVRSSNARYSIMMNNIFLEESSTITHKVSRLQSSDIEWKVHEVADFIESKRKIS